MLVFLLFLLPIVVISSNVAPHDLRANKMLHGVVSTPSPKLSWILPHLRTCAKNQKQIAYQIQLHTAGNTDKISKDTGKVLGSSSIHVKLNILLTPTTRYKWRVRTWGIDINGKVCKSTFSKWHEFITTPFHGFGNNTLPIWYPSSNAKFTLHRTIVQKQNSPYKKATAFVTALQSGKQQKLLGAYRLYINEESVGIGPGRGDGPTNAGNHTPFDSIDVTGAVMLSNATNMVIGLQCYSAGDSGESGVMLELHLEHIDGTKSIVSTTNNVHHSGSLGWMSFDATTAFGPTNMEGHYNAPQENQDASLMPLGWQSLSFNASTSWKTPKISAEIITYPKITLPLNISTGRKPVRWLKVESNRWFADFGTEFQGGLRLETKGFSPRTRLQITLSEELVGDYKTSTKLLFPMRTGNTYRSVWTTTASGTSIFEHHEYMEFRYAEVLVLTKEEDAPIVSTTISLTLTAWSVQYPYFEGHSSFRSSSSLLNSIWSFCENTLRVTSLDTTTDSNTRERLPYEADGFITGMSRINLQREFGWPTHSWTHNIFNPTWPTEWRQTAVFFAYFQFMYFGELELINRFADVMEAQTQSPCIDKKSTQLVDFTSCKRQTGGMGAGNELELKDIVDWPQSQRDGFVFSNINTVINSYSVGGLRALATLGKAGGGVAFNLPNRSSGIEKIADAVTDAMNSLCRDKNGLYYDGLNATNPNIHSSWHAQIFPAAFGVAPEESWPQILTFLKKKGMAGSVYGSYWALKAAYAMDSDHGELALQLLTATAQTVNSWAHMIEVGATATMEAWSREEKPNLSWSHPWATSPLSAVVFGIFGIEPLLPAFQTFRCKPQPGSLTSASITVPTIKGAIVASFNVTVNVSTVFTLHISPPPNTMATVCLPKLNQSGNELLLDGKLVDGYSLRDYICIDNIGSSYTSREIIRKEFKR